jgi:SAM-dependent methyltransferase
MNIHEEAQQWVDTEAYAQAIKDRFTGNVMACESLWEHRQFCARGYGMGEDSFHWMWKLLVDEMLGGFNFLEVGVYMGQIPSLIRLLADFENKDADITGVTMLSPFSGVTGARPPHPDVDYRAGIQRLHDNFDQPMPHLIVGDSTSDEVHAQVEALAPFDMIFVDACHEYDYVASDLQFYPKLIKPGGYLICDDAACDLKQPWGFFQGIADVCDAVRTFILTDPQWEHVITVCHDRIWRKQ